MRLIVSILAGLALVMVFTARAEDNPRVLTLADAVRLALEKNPDLATAQHRLAAARAAIQQADASLYPQIRVSESYTASDNPVQSFMMTLNQRSLNMATANFNHPGTTDNLNTHLLATYPLYNGGRDQATRQAARLGSEATAQSLEAVRNELVFEVTRAYYTVGKARQFNHAAEAAVASMAANANVASNRVAAGQSLKSDYLDAQVRLAEARENLIRTQNAVALSETIFRNVLGVDEKDNITAGDIHRSDIPVATGSGESTTAGIAHRPELLAAQKAVAVAEQQVRAAQSGHRPRVNAFASYDLDSGNASQFEDSWVAGISVELDLFDGFLTRGKVGEARAKLAAAREQLRRTELALQLEAKQAQLNLTEAQSRFTTTERVVAQAEESVQITKDRYAGGLALLTQLLDAETALTGARQRRAAAEVDELIARAALDKALGVSGKELQ